MIFRYKAKENYIELPYFITIVRNRLHTQRDTPKHGIDFHWETACFTLPLVQQKRWSPLWVIPADRKNLGNLHGEIFAVVKGGDVMIFFKDSGIFQKWGVPP